MSDEPKRTTVEAQNVDEFSVDGAKDGDESSYLEQLLDDPPENADETGKPEPKAADKRAAKPATRKNADEEALDDPDARADTSEAESDEDEIDFDLEFDDGTAANQDPYESAVKALELDGWSRKELESLPRDRVVALGTKRAATHAEIDRKLAASKSTTRDEDRDEEGAAGRYDESHDALAGLWGDEDDARAKGSTKTDEARDTRIQALSSQLQRIEAQQARARLLVKYPQLKDPRRFSEAFQSARALLKSGQFRTIGAALHGASKLRWADEMIEATRESDNREAKRRSAGAPMSSGQRGGERKITRDEAETRYLDAKLSGDEDRAARYRKLLG